MNLPLALYRVKLGRNAGNDQTDNWMSRDVLAKNTADAIKRVKRSKSEYVAEVVLLGRADE